MEKVIIHIGLHKTGTTFLQRQYFPCVENWNFYNKAIAFGDFAYERKENVLISNESLSGRPWNTAWLRGKKNNFCWLGSFKLAVTNLKQFFPNAHIVVVFRKHGDLMVSLYKQYVQEGGVLELEKFYGPTGVIKEKDLSFQYRLEFLKESFDQVTVLSFESFKEEGTAYFKNFFSSLGIQDQFTENTKRENSSISGEKIDLLRNINKYYNRAPKKVKDLLAFTRFTPRKIFQKRLSFWKTSDSEKLKNFKKELNSLYKEDWIEIEKEFWNKGNNWETKKD